MINELQILKTVIKKLEKGGIPYMITGSIAANFYTIPRMTRDIDIIIDVEENDTDKLIEIFSDEYYISKDSVKNAIRNRKIFNIIHNDALVKIDFIIKKNTEYRTLEFDRKKSINFEGEKIYVTCPEDLVISKLYWAKESESEIQIKDIRNLLKSTPDMDSEYIAEWVKKLGLAGFYKKVSHE